MMRAALLVAATCAWMTHERVDAEWAHAVWFLVGAVALQLALPPSRKNER